ncbi:hypothetical protein ACQY0O_004078 [Thecaphora frezii]
MAAASLTSAVGTFQGHSSSDIAAALAAYAAQMHRIDSQFKSLASSPSQPGTSFQGHSSSDIADAIASYAHQHRGQGWPSDFAEAGDAPSTASSSSGLNTTTSKMAQFEQLAAVSTTAATSSAAAFSLAAKIASANWMSIVFAIVWIGAGLLLILFGWSSLFWLHKLGDRSRSRIDEKPLDRHGRAIKERRRCCNGPPLAGGAGGLVVGFVFFSYTGLVVVCAACAKSGGSISSGALFVVWLLPGLVGAVLGGHFAFCARVFAGLVAGPCLSVVVTAMFGIHALIIRTVIVVVFTCLATAPLLVPNRSVLHFHLVNACLSIAGMVALLDGVALYAPPKASSAAWIDLWVVLFAADGSASLTAAIRKWGSSSFKGYIAGAVLGAVIGFVFELVLHKRASQDPEAEWNAYLGSYTQRFESGMEAAMPGLLHGGPMGHRAGSFEPSPSPWSRISNLFGRAGSSKPASYGNLPTASNDVERSPLTERPGGGMRKDRRKARTGAGRKKVRTATTTKGPAKFSALSKRELDSGESDSDLTDYDSDDTMQKLHPRGGGGGGDHDEEDDMVSPLAQLQKVAASSPTVENYRGYALPRPPSYRTNSAGASSTWSGSTAASSNTSGSRHSDREAGPPTPSAAACDVERPFSLYKDGDALERVASPTSSLSIAPSGGSILTSRSTATATAPAPVPATPSLINAISRIQAAQAQARAWQEAQREAESRGEAAPYGAQPLSPMKEETKLLDAAAGEDGDDDDDDGTCDAAERGDKFDEWWARQVDAKAKRSGGRS